MPSDNTLFVNFAWRRFPFCQWCLRYLEHRLAATCDHLIPRYCGGPDCWTNLLVACHECNNERGHTLPGLGLKAWFKNPDGNQGTYDRPHGPHWLPVGRKRRSEARRLHIQQRDPCAPGAAESTARPLTEARPPLTKWYCDCARCQEIILLLPDSGSKRFKTIEPPRVVRATMTIEGEDTVLTTAPPGEVVPPKLAPVIIVEAALVVPEKIIYGRTSGPELLR